MPGRASKAGSGRARPAAGLSIIVPLYNEANGLERLHERILDVVARIKAERRIAVEIVYIDDGSRDATHSVAAALPAGPLDVQLVTLSRNFGKEAALLAGLDHARFGALLFMDGDGQHPPELIETLVSRWQDDGYDVVYTAKADRESEPLLRRAGVRWFYTLVNWGMRQKIPEDAGDFRLLSPRAAKALRQMPERNRFFKGMSSWIGFRQVRVDYHPAPRAHGATTWNVWSLIGLSIEGLTSFTVAPLRVASLLGGLLSVSALLYGLWILLQTLFYGQDVPGYPSIMVGIMVIGGVQLMMIGVLGEYVGKLLSEIKARPVYFVADHAVKAAENADDTSAKPQPAAPRAAE
jgi:glycosyltransferase involved in cell wall biosynthesis